MTANSPYFFEVQPRFTVLMRITVWISSTFAVLFVALPLLATLDDGSLNPGALAVAAIGGPFFGMLAWYSRRVRKGLLSAGVAVDADGLWPIGLAKSQGLVRWGSIYTIRERPVLQRLDLLGAGGNLLIKVEYQLTGFDTLRSWIVDHARPPGNLLKLPAVHAKPAWHHAFNVASMVGFALLGWYVGGNGNTMIGYGGMTFVVLLIAHEYLTTIWKLELSPDHLTAHTPWARRRLDYADIAAVRLADTFASGNRHPAVLVIPKHGKPVTLQKLGVASADLYRTLSALCPAPEDDADEADPQDAE